MACKSDKTDTWNLDGIEVEIVRKHNKNMYLRVIPPSGKARVSVPLRMSNAAIHDFILSRLDWIRQHQERMRACTPLKIDTYDQDDVLVVWGRPRKIRFFPTGGRRRIFLDGECIDLHARLSDSAEQRRQLYESLLYRELIRELPDMFAKWCPIIGVPMPFFSIRRMRTRWGSCSPATKRIRIALHLSEKPFRCLEYVVVHELVHLLERGHKKRFRGFMDRFLPDWKAMQDETG